MVKWFKRFVSDWAPVVVSLGAFCFVFNFIIINAVIPSGSMMNQIRIGDRIVGNRLAYKWEEPERFDVVIFKYPLDKDSLYIKRIIGLPGEVVRIWDGKVYVDDSGECLDEWYLPEEWVLDNNGYIFCVPEDSYLVLGDNRNSSNDARFWGEEAFAQRLDPEQYTYVCKDDIVAKAVCRYYPTPKMLK